MAQVRVVQFASRPRDPVGMSRPCAPRCKNRRGRAGSGALPPDLHDYANMPEPRVGRPVKHDLSTWTATDDWSEHIPVTVAEVDLFEAWFGDLFDDLFGPCR